VLESGQEVMTHTTLIEDGEVANCGLRSSNCELVVVKTEDRESRIWESGPRISVDELEEIWRKELCRLP